MERETMRRILHFFMFSFAIVIALIAPHGASAQVIGAKESTPMVDIFGGYTYVHANTVATDTSIGVNGGSGSVAYNFNRWLGLVGDVGFYEQDNVAETGHNLTLLSYQFGPRVSFRGHGRMHLVPFAQALVGAGHASGSLYTKSLGGGEAPIGANTNLLFTAGGGVDLKLTHTFGIRIIQAEYMYSQFSNGLDHNNRQNNVRLSAGILISLGDR
jgi:hypothetical protein